MSKRFTETTKWDAPWFRKMKPVYKSFIQYLWDRCDSAGVWEVDMELAATYVGEQIDPMGALEAFAGRVVDAGDGKWIVTGFIPFQYGDLKPECKPHKPVLALVKKHGLCRNGKGYAKGIDTLQEKEQEKDKEKDKEEEGCGEKQGGNFYEQRDPRPAPNTDQFAKAFEIATKLIRILNELTGQRFSEAGEHMNLIANRVHEVHCDYAGLKLMIDRKVREWKGTKYSIGLNPKKLFGDDFHTYYGQREAPIILDGHTRPSDIRATIEGKERRMAELKRKHHSETQSLIGGKHYPAGWRDDKAKDLYLFLKREVEDLRRQLERT